MEGICVNFLDLVQFSDFLRDVAMATNLVAKMWQNYLPSALIALSFRKLIGYRHLNVCINSVSDASISCENFVKFSPVTSELTGLICECQVRHSQKLAHLVEYLRTYWTDFRNLFTVWKHSTCRWGTLPWQPNNFGKMLSTPTNTTCIRGISARKRIAISWYSCVH